MDQIAVQREGWYTVINGFRRLGRCFSNRLPYLFQNLLYIFGEASHIVINIFKWALLGFHFRSFTIYSGGIVISGFQGRSHSARSVCATREIFSSLLLQGATATKHRRAILTI